MPPALKRNFCIIAHIDHGKSTLSDRMLEDCGLVDKRQMRPQFLDRLELERERGITIKAQCVTLPYKALNGDTYSFNLIDTPGHVDFSYEVSRSLAACEGALLLVDASQGVQAQTLATCYEAVAQGLEVIPVLNKMDLDHAEPERVRQEIEDMIGLDASTALGVSGRTGEGVRDLMELVVSRIPAPQVDESEPFRALVVDSWFDPHQGVISLVRVVSGSLNKGMRVMLNSSELVCQIERLGIFAPDETLLESLQAGDVGFVCTGVKDLRAIPVGDTLIAASAPKTPSLPGFEQPEPRVFAAFFPLDSGDYEAFTKALDQLRLNDAAITCAPEVSEALGHGWRLGFLGTLHMEVTQGRLEKEFGLDLLVTAPTVQYRVLTTAGEELRISSPAKLPERQRISSISEPVALASILVPPQYLGKVLELCRERRGEIRQQHHGISQVALQVYLPLSGIVLDFFDRLKSATRGLASLDYHLDHFQEASLRKLDVLVNGEVVDALAAVVHSSDAERRGRALIKRIAGAIPRQMFEVSVQAATGGKILARETVKALRKNVTAKCYGGDITRKRKLLEKQKAGKKRMKSLGRVQIPQEAFLNALRTGDN